MKIKKRCPMCGKSHILEVTDTEKEVQLKNYIYSNSEERPLIQDALSLFTKQEREFYMTGYCIDCQKKLFAKPKGCIDDRDIATTLYAMSLDMDFADTKEFWEKEISQLTAEIANISDVFREVLENIAMENEDTMRWLDELLQKQ